jgi:hypothetical protein
MKEPLLYIAITEGPSRLEISGTLYLFHQFLKTINRPEVFNPCPDQLDPSIRANVKR